MRDFLLEKLENIEMFAQSSTLHNYSTIEIGFTFSHTFILFYVQSNNNYIRVKIFIVINSWRLFHASRSTRGRSKQGGGGGSVTSPQTRGKDIYNLHGISFGEN